MMLKAAVASLVACSQAATFFPSYVTNVTNFWPANDHAPAGGHIKFTLDQSIALGQGSCDITIDNVNPLFVHFHNAHIGTYGGSNTWSLYSVAGWEGKDDTYTFSFISENQASLDDVTISCNDTPLDAAAAILSSFPGAPNHLSARGSFTVVGGHEGTWPADVTLSFNVDTGPSEIILDDESLTATEQAADSWVISGLTPEMKYDDVGFTINYDRNNVTVSAYEITVT